MSSVSIWEAAIKIQLGKLNADINALIDSIETEGLIELPLTAKQAVIITQLPDYHRDPFDRMLIAPEQQLAGDKLFSGSFKNAQEFEELIQMAAL